MQLLTHDQTRKTYIEELCKGVDLDPSLRVVIERIVAGEIELEQAYVEYDLTENHHAKAGVFLLPVGILNETHEPPTFYGVERNPVESNIIPTTWWAGGIAANGEIAPGWSYDIGVHEDCYYMAMEYLPRNKLMVGPVSSITRIHEHLYAAPLSCLLAQWMNSHSGKKKLRIMDPAKPIRYSVEKVM